MNELSAQEPAFFGHLRRSIAAVSVDQRGIAEQWKAPVAIYDAPSGFGEEVWTKAQPDTVLAWMISGADVRCEWGPRRGTVLSTKRQVVALQPRGMPNHFSAQGPIKFGQFLISDALLTAVARDLDKPVSGGEALRPDLIDICDEALRSSLAAYAARAASVAEPPTRVETEARAILIVERLLSRHCFPAPRPVTGGLPTSLQRRVIDHLHAHLAENISVTELATIAGLSSFHFCRAFKEASGLPPHRYQLMLRIERAKDLLANSRHSISEVAAGVGYDDPGQLARLFRKQVGVTPTQYRRERRT